MYCKHCGKQIADDSSFCQYCGEKVIDELLLSENSTILPANNKNISEEGTSEVIIVTKEANPIQVEVSKKGKDNSSTIANEIVGNLKMVGVALCIFLVYMMGVVLIHSKDAKPLDENSYWGESCYDPTTMSSNRMFHWHQHYAKRVCMVPSFKSKGADSTSKCKFTTFFCKRTLLVLRNCSSMLNLRTQRHRATDFLNSLYLQKT